MLRIYLLSCDSLGVFMTALLKFAFPRGYQLCPDAILVLIHSVRVIPSARVEWSLEDV